MPRDHSRVSRHTEPCQYPSPPTFSLCRAVRRRIRERACPYVFFSATRLFGHIDPCYRALVAVVVMIEYAIAFLLLLLHADEAFASGDAVATATIVTLGSAGLAFLIVEPAGWGWDAVYAEILVLGGLAFAVLANAVFLVASVRYARAIHPRLHIGGLFLGIIASLALLVLYSRISSVRATRISVSRSPI